MIRKELLASLCSLVGSDGVTTNNLFDKVKEKVPDVTHDELGAALGRKLKDLFPAEDFPSGVHMGQLNEPLKSGQRRHPDDCVVKS